MAMYETSKSPDSSNHDRRYLLSKIQDGSQLKITGSTNISETVTYITKIPTVNLRQTHRKCTEAITIMTDSLKCRPKPEMIISETMKGTDKIPTTNLGHNIMYWWQRVLASKYSSDQQPEISIWPPKPEIIMSLELWQIVSKFQRQIRDFWWWRARYKWLAKWLRQRSTTIKASLAPKTSILFFWLSVVATITQGQFYLCWAWSKTPGFPLEFHPICHSFRDIRISGFCGHIAISACRSLSQSLGDILFWFAMVENHGFAVGIVMISVILSEIQVLLVWMAHCYFWLSVNVGFISGHFLSVWHGRKICLPS